MTTSEQQAVPVAQEDREAAANLLLAIDYVAESGAGWVRDGHVDIGPTVQAFARHRLAPLPCKSGEAAELEAGKDELRRLMDSIWRAEYRSDAPDWKPLDDLAGMVSQIDNMYAGVRGQRDQARWDLHNPAPDATQTREAEKGEALQRDEAKVAATGSVEGLSSDWWGVECSGCTLPRRDCECN